MYYYFPDGKRAAKWQGNGAVIEEYVYDMEGHQVSAHNGSGGVLRNEIYDPDGRHLATYASSALDYNLADWLGTERVRISSSGTVINSCSDTPYGMNIACSTPDPSPMHFTGLQYDAETAMSHALNRQYPMNLGRWLTADPAGKDAVELDDPQMWNLYAYVRNDPLTLTDPSGLSSDPYQDSIDGIDRNTMGIGGGLRPPDESGLADSSYKPDWMRNDSCKRGGCIIASDVSGNSHYQERVRSFYRSPFGRVVKFFSPLALLPGWNPDWKGNVADWAEAILSKGAALLFISHPDEIASVITGVIKGIGSGIENGVAGTLKVLEKAGPWVMGVSTAIDVIAHQLIYSMDHPETVPTIAE